jgi:FkbM family methyltransferase
MNAIKAILPERLKGPMRLASRKLSLWRAKVAPETRRSVRYFGSQNNGWTIDPNILPKNGRCFSFGVGEDISFETELLKTIECEVHAFDPTPTVNDRVLAEAAKHGIAFHRIGLAPFDGRGNFVPAGTRMYRLVPTAQPEPDRSCEVRRIETIHRQLGGGRIDILKLDVEGAEFDLIDDLCAIEKDVVQLLVEFHYYWPDFGPERLSRAVVQLRKSGYQLYSISWKYSEFSFINSRFASLPSC